MNAIVFGEEMGKGIEGCGLFWCHFHYAVNDDKMISPAIIVYDKFTTIIVAIYHSSLLEDIPSEQVEVF